VGSVAHNIATEAQEHGDTKERLTFGTVPPDPQCTDNKDRLTFSNVYSDHQYEEIFAVNPIHSPPEKKKQPAKNSFTEVPMTMNPMLMKSNSSRPEETEKRTVYTPNSTPTPNSTNSRNITEINTHLTKAVQQYKKEIPPATPQEGKNFPIFHWYASFNLIVHHHLIAPFTKCYLSSSLSLFLHF
jgi:hypothetical protein